MEKKLSLIVFTVLIISFTPQVFAQEENEEFSADADISMYQHFSIEEKKNRIGNIQEITNGNTLSVVMVSSTEKSVGFISNTNKK